MINKSDIVKNFLENIDTVGMREDNIFCLPFDHVNSEIIVIPVCWDVTTSYGTGTSMAPTSIFQASHQIDLYNEFNPDGWISGISMVKEIEYAKLYNDKYRRLAEKHIKKFAKENLLKTSETEEVNKASVKLNEAVEEAASYWLDQGKIVSILGGDHSTPYGLIAALAKRHAGFGILHFDAHSDLRESYEGFEFSHASIMYNILKFPQITKLVQIGIRDFSHQEKVYIDLNKSRIENYSDWKIRNLLMSKNNSWEKICDDIVNLLPEKIYLSFDIDVLDIAYCPNTGTPVPGGLSFHQAEHLLEKVAKSGKKIIGFDLVEVSPGTNSINCIVGARILYKLFLSTSYHTSK